MCDVCASGGCFMIRTQVYLTDEEKRSLSQLSDQSGRSQSALIREAIDIYITNQRTLSKSEILAAAAGMWRDRTDLPDFDELRSSWDREFGL